MQVNIPPVLIISIPCLIASVNLDGYSNVVAIEADLEDGESLKTFIKYEIFYSVEIYH